MNKYKIKDGYYSYNHNLMSCFKDYCNKQSFTILDIGCNEGGNLAYIQEFYPGGVCCGTDINEAALEIAQKNVPQGAFALNNIEQLNLPVKKHAFDFILLSSVLQHLKTPKEVLIYLKKFLTSTGIILLSVPMLTYWIVMYNLLINNRFDYNNTGLLDTDHCHFFTKSSLIELFHQSKYDILTMNPIIPPEPEDIWENEKYFHFNLTREEVNNFVDKLVLLNPEINRDTYLTYGYILVIKPNKHIDKIEIL